MWSDFESEVVEGRYRLGRSVRTEGRCAWYESNSGEKPVLVSLIESLNDEASLLEPLKAAARIHHPNVMKILESGATVVKQTPLVYAVMEFTEENLEDVLRSRALTADETRQVAESLIEALKAIHKEGLTTGRLEAANVLAAGDTVKLRSDHLLVASDDTLRAQKTKDMQGLGVLLHQCLTQRPPKSSDSNDPSLQLLPPPFIQVVRRAISGQSSLEDLSALLKGQKLPAEAAAASVPPPAAPVPQKPVPQKQAPQKSVEPAAKKIEPLPPKKASAVQPVAADVLSEEPSGASRSPLLIGGVVVLLVIVALGLWLFLRPVKSPSAAQDSPRKVVVESPDTPSVPQAKPAPAVAPAPRAVPASAPVAAKPVPAASQPSSTPATGDNKIWRVIAYTYNHQDQAQKKVESIQSRHPDLKPEVFSAKGRAPYLVSLGGGMEHDAAAQFRQTAIRQGMPRDTYTQNYGH